MFFVYLFAAVAGCLLVLVSLAGGAHHDGSADGDGAPLTDAGAHDATGAGSSEGHHTAHEAAGHAAGMSAALGWLLSVQLWTYLLAFGGLTGLLLRTVARMPEPLAGGCALAVGLVTALGARAVLRRALGSSDSGVVSHDRLVGSSAQVLIPAEPGGTGKIRLTARGQLLDLLARASDGGALPAGARVSILDVRDGIAEVLREDELPDLAAAAQRGQASAVPRSTSLASSSSSSSGAGSADGGSVPPARRQSPTSIKG